MTPCQHEFTLHNNFPEVSKATIDNPTRQKSSFATYQSSFQLEAQGSRNSSCASGVQQWSRAWVVVATELISNLDTVSPVTVPTGMTVPPSAFSVGFNFSCCWHRPPGLRFELWQQWSRAS